MGCDIHTFVETRKNKTEPWKFSGEIFDNGYYRKDDKISEWNEPKTHHFYDGRNYFLFAVLADVRNKYKVNPIKEPLGLPVDTSDEIKKENDDWGSDGHSHTYFPLKELVNFNWNQIQRFSGVVGFNRFKSYLKNGEPDSWCESLSTGNRIQIMTPEEMQRMIEANYSFHSEDDKRGWYTVINWEKTYKEYCKSFLESLEKLKSLGKPENVRVIIWFDN